MFTLKGRVVYNRKIHFFGPRDAERVLKAVDLEKVQLIPLIRLYLVLFLRQMEIIRTIFRFIGARIQVFELVKQALAQLGMFLEEISTDLPVAYREPIRQLVLVIRSLP